MSASSAAASGQAGGVKVSLHATVTSPDHVACTLTCNGRKVKVSFSPRDIDFDVPEDE